MPEATGLHAIDWIIICVYACSTIGLGYYYGRRQSDTKEYFVGSGNMPWFLVGVSLFATLMSTITYLAIPGEVLGKGPIYVTSLLIYPVIYIVVGHYILPTYMKFRFTSAYELLEARLGLSVRLLGAFMFLALRLVWMSLLVYLAAKAMSVMMGVDEKWIPLIVIVTGFVSVVYTSLGGLRAVVITDFVQASLLLGGAFLVIAMVTWDMGGFGWIPMQWQPHWDSQPLFPDSIKTRVSVFGSLVSIALWYICTSAGDQVSVQRFMATRDVHTARRALITQLVVSAISMSMLAFVGFALMGYFQTHGDALPAELSIEGTPDKLYPHFISFNLPIGISGLVVAAMFAAAMSSIDSGVNSITAVVTTDLLDRFGWQPKTEKGHVLAARILAFTVGAIVVIGSSFMEHIEGNFTTMAQKTANLLVIPIFCLFYFAVFAPRTRPIAVWIGWIFGVTTATLIAFSGNIFGLDPETGYDPISFQWIGPAALVVNIGVGHAVSALVGKRQIAHEHPE
jgi:SSS family solute:Na+ symporter